MFNTLEKNILFIEQNKNTILDIWLNYKIVQETLFANTFDIQFFRDKFASKVFDFAVSVVKSDNKVGNCPVIGVMLILFKKKNIALADVFMICVHLKNAFLHFLHNNTLLDNTMIDEISMLMDYNFSGVIKEYTLLYYDDEYINKTCLVEKTNTKQTPIDKEKIIELKKQNSTSATTYLQEIDLDTELIAELDELESDTINAIDAEESITQNSLIGSANLFYQYAKVLNSMFEFKELAYTLTILQELLSSTEVATLNEETKSMVSIYLKAIINDLQSWRMSVFVICEAEDIHYLDKTLMSSIAQLQITLMPQKEAEEDEIEFF